MKPTSQEIDEILENARREQQRQRERLGNPKPAPKPPPVPSPTAAAAEKRRAAYAGRRTPLPPLFLGQHRVYRLSPEGFRSPYVMNRLWCEDCNRWVPSGIGLYFFRDGSTESVGDCCGYWAMQWSKERGLYYPQPPKARAEGGG